MSKKCLTSWMVLFALCQSPVTQAKEPYTLGVFPHLPASRLIEFYTPLAETFSDILERRIRLKSRPTFALFFQKLAEESHDLAYIQPFDYVDAYAKYHYLPLLRINKPLSMIMLVTKDSPIQTLEDLKGQIIASPPKSAAVYHMARMSLRQAGFDLDRDVKFMFTKNHTACYQRVLSGQAQACNTAHRALSIAHKKNAQLAANFRIIHESKPIPHSLIVAHSRVPQSERQRIKEYLLQNPLAFWGELIEAKDSDYEPVRRYWQNEQ